MGCWIFFEGLRSLSVEHYTNFGDFFAHMQNLHKHHALTSFFYSFPSQRVTS